MSQRFVLFIFLLLARFSFEQSERKLLYAQAIEFGYQNQNKESEALLSRIIEIYPNDSMAYFDRAIMREILGDTLGAISDFTNQISIVPNEADAYFLRGILYYKTQQFKLALRDFKQVNQLDEGNADAHFFTAQLYVNLNKSKRIARNQLRICLQLNPEHDDAAKLLNSINCKAIK